jgi:hypothetical protein
MVLTERDWRALKLGGSGLAVLLVYFGGIEPLWGRYDALVSRHAKAAGQVAQAVGRERKARYYEQQIEDWQAKAGPLTSPLPYAQQMTEVSGRLVKAAQEAGLRIKGTTPTASAFWPDDPTLQRASILVEAEADWENVFKFVAGLYRTEGILSIEEMDISGDAKKGGSLGVKLTVSFLVQAEADGARWSR